MDCFNVQPMITTQDLLNVNWTNVTERIEKIYLQLNNLTYLDASMFTFMDYQLLELQLYSNAISIVNLSDAIYLPKTLYLTRNKIRQFISPIDKHQIKTHMDALYLNENGITNLNDSYFQFPENLKILFLDENNIQGIMNETTVTKTIQNAETLYLDYNKITIVKHNYLPKYTYLRYNRNLYKVESNSTQLTELHVKFGTKAQNLKSSNFKHSNVFVC